MNLKVIFYYKQLEKQIQLKLKKYLFWKLLILNNYSFMKQYCIVLWFFCILNENK